MPTPQTKEIIQGVIARLEAKQKTRILAFGSSNTERRIMGNHWFDVLDLALKKKYGRFHHSINTGVGGHTTQDHLDRFEEDAAFYSPHLVILTVGGNDHNRKVPLEQIEANFRELHRRFTAIGVPIAFQTYYSPDPTQLPPLDGFYTLMEAMRGIAAETGSALIDQLTRWELLRKNYPERYAPLMLDGFHVNTRGNLLMGVELARAFGAGDALCAYEELEEAHELQALIDDLEKKQVDRS